MGEKHQILSLDSNPPVGKRWPTSSKMAEGRRVKLHCIYIKCLKTYQLILLSVTDVRVHEVFLSWVYGFL